MKAKIRGTEIFFDVAGMQLVPHQKKIIKKPVVFMLHGGPGANHMRFKQNSLELSEDAQLVFIDHRGCGRSKKTKIKDYTLENNVKDIESLRRYLGLEKIVILGNSYGGIVAQAYAIRYPKYIERLILVVTTPSYHFIKEAQAYLEKHGGLKQIKASEKLWQGTFKNNREVYQYFKLMGPLYSFNNRKVKPSKTSSWSFEVLNKGFQTELRKFNFIKKLKKIRCPTLILAGKHDWICRPNQAKILAEHIPHSKLKIFKKSGHMLAEDAHELYIKIARSFLKPLQKII